MKVLQLSDGAREKPGRTNGVPQNRVREEKAFNIRYCNVVQKHLTHRKKRS